MVLHPPQSNFSHRQPVAFSGLRHDLERFEILVSVVSLAILLTLPSLLVEAGTFLDSVFRRSDSAREESAAAMSIGESQYSAFTGPLAAE